ncbi:MAG: phenylalanine--tRNA ligase subunit beta, partial [Candidatus Odinarchaeia archaeon]
MPTIEINADELTDILGEKIEIEKLEDHIRQIGLDVEGHTDNVIKAEYNPNRPDYSTIEGVARQLKGYLEIETGLPKFKVEKSKLSLTVESSVKEVRPYIVCGVIRNVSFDDEKIQRLMKVQEDLHWLVGRNRLKAAIGVHDLKNIKPPFRYLAVKPEEISFVPLNETRKMNLKEILENHPKGIEYADLVRKHEKYPIILDKNNEVLSFPPIINGVLTQVNEETKDLFLDITGTTETNIIMALNILSTVFYDQGSKIESVKVIYPDKEIITPNLEPSTVSILKNNVVKTLGLELTGEAIVNLLSKARFGASAKKQDGKEIIEVQIPSYRFDILHEIDIIEEIAIGYGYENIKPTHNYSMTVAQPLIKNKILEKMRQVLVGLQFLEVVNFTLTN